MYMLDAYMQRFEHPYLLTLIPIAILLFLLSVVTELIGNHTAAGFFVLYGINTVFFLLFGYAFFFVLKLSTHGIRWFRMRDSGMS